MKKKKIRFLVIPLLILAILLVALGVFFVFREPKSELKTIRSQKELEKIYEGKQTATKEFWTYVFGMPFSFLAQIPSPLAGSSIDMAVNDATSSTIGPSSISGVESSTSKDFSKTNIQVENVDEADITKTDGDYIYSLSGTDVMITDVRNPENLQVVSRISSNSTVAPEDLILAGNHLVVISSDTSARSQTATSVRIYDIHNKEKPSLVKSFTLYAPYYTSRYMNNKLYVISSGYLHKEDGKILIHYTEDFASREIPLNHMQYFTDVPSRKQTLISMVDLTKPTENIHLNSYFLDISNSYVSEHNIYLFDQDYEYGNYAPPISSLFGLKGAIGPFVYNSDDLYTSRSITKVSKFKILEDGSISFATQGKVEGKTINQYSFDEHNGQLRLALYDFQGSRIVILDENLKEIGKTLDLAKGETMYSSRFMGDKAYLVTYQTVDPLYVVDLSDPTHPRALGELKIPGYSTYLHPYDENHIIGIGMETQENVVRDTSGKVLRTTSTIVGMKMALFDVSDVANPVQVSSTITGDRRTTSAILTNPKALLFSKEKELIAIPINNFAEDFGISSSATSYASVVQSYTNYAKPYISEGYAVYRINLQEGFTLKGVITHEKTTTRNYWRNNSKLLRGLYIGQDLFTVSENGIKVNDLDSLTLKNELVFSARSNHS